MTLSFQRHSENDSVKKWFILIGSKKEGPYSLKELKKDFRLTPDTLAWTVGYKEWIPLRFIPELQKIFKDEHEIKSPDEPYEQDKEIKTKPIIFEDQLTLTLKQDPFQFYLWILIIIIVLFYTLYRIY